jgi:hypothetical protein
MNKKVIGREGLIFLATCGAAVLLTLVLQMIGINLWPLVVGLASIAIPLYVLVRAAMLVLSQTQVPSMSTAYQRLNSLQRTQPSPHGCNRGIREGGPLISSGGVISMKTLLLTAFFICCTSGEVFACMRGPDHQWTVQFAGEQFGIIAFDARPPSPQHTYLLCGPRQFEFPLSFPVTIAFLCVPIFATLFLISRMLFRRYPNSA